MPDIIIIGGGPAGLSAAIYAKRAGADAVVLEKTAVGGQIAKTHNMENYPGIFSVSGVDFTLALKQQAEKLGADITSCGVKRIERRAEGFALSCDSGELTCRAVIAAMGASAKKLGIPGEDELLGSGVSYCATCDGGFFKNMDVAVIGGGDTALSDAIYLSKIAKSVKLIHRRDKLRAQDMLISQAAALENVEFILNAQVKRLEGSFGLEGLIYERDCARHEIKVDGCFIAVGSEPQTSVLRGLCDIDENGYVLADETCVTKTAGLFVAGDIRKKPLKQVVTAAADGAVAATAACEYLQRIKSTGGYPENWCY